MGPSLASAGLRYPLRDGLLINEALLARHYQGRRGFRPAALLDIAQDHALAVLGRERLFDMGAVLKGGTHLRKCYAGNAGRFSTDLDFAVPDETTGLIILDVLDGAELGGFRFSLSEVGGLRGRLNVDSPLGRPDIVPKVEITTRPIWLPVRRLPMIELPVHRAYDAPLPTIPVPTFEEALAEKIAAFRRRAKLRDLYDLHWSASRKVDEALVRRLAVLKVWSDVNESVLGGRGPFVPSVDVLGHQDAREFPPENIGLLTQPVDPNLWLATVNQRYQYLDRLTTEERRWAVCDPRHKPEVLKAIRALGERTGATGASSGLCGSRNTTDRMPCRNPPGCSISGH